jgi:methyl-accepting chemotaxis protein
MTTDFRNRRRNFYIKKEFQRNFILKFCALVAAGAVLSGLIVYVLSTSTVTTTFENSRLTIKSTADYILPAVLISGVVVVALVGVATIIVTLFTSHKIAGALYAIEKRVDEVASLNLKTEFRLRTDDQIKPLAVGLDVMTSKLRSNVKEIKDAISALEAAVDSRGRANIPADIVARLEELRAKAGKFNT